MERAMLGESLSASFAGSGETVRRGLADLLARTRADEVMVAGQIHDHAARLRSFAIAAEVRDALGSTASPR